jgi:hypothetical protein
MTLRLKSDEEFAAEGLGLDAFTIGLQANGVSVDYFWTLAILPSFDIPAFLAVVLETTRHDGVTSRLRGVFHTGGDIAVSEIPDDPVIKAMASPTDAPEAHTLDGTICRFRFRSMNVNSDFKFFASVSEHRWSDLDRAAHDIAAKLVSISRNKTLSAFLSQSWRAPEA